MRIDGKCTQKALLIPAAAAKQLGRTVYHPDTGTLWCSHSGTGIAFSAYGNRCKIILKADSAYRCKKCAARYAIYLNGKLHSDSLLTAQKRTAFLPVSPEGTDIRIIKLSESAISSLGIGIIRIDASAEAYEKRHGKLLNASPEQAHLIEFIGDSITCGYGIDGICEKDAFSTANENAQKGYAMLTAALLHADYSLVSFSGYGLLSGYTADGRINRNELIQPHYEKIGHCKAELENMRHIDDDAWQFQRQPDLIVINLGTNDSSYTGNDSEKQAKFTAAYAAFLKTVRAKNPDAPILCVLGIMGQTLCDAVSSATAQTGDKQITVLRLDEQKKEDGFAVDWHPSAVTHNKAAEALSAYIRQQLGW